MSNLYASLQDVKLRLGITSTDDDVLLLDMIEANSRIIDQYVQRGNNRGFFTEQATREFDTIDNGVLLIPDLLTLTSLKRDTEQDGNFDDETWVEGTDFFLAPYDQFPKTEVRVTSFSDFSGFCHWDHSGCHLDHSVQIVGEWGYGDGQSDNPTETLTVTGEVANATTDVLTLSGTSTQLFAGHTLLIESEQVFVTAVSGTAVTIERAKNGTVAVAHTPTKAIAKYLYPEDVKRTCIMLTTGDFQQRDTSHLKMLRIGDLTKTFSNEAASGTLKIPALDSYRRGVFA